MNSARKFLAKGNKVKVTLRFRGREMAHMNSSKHILDDIAKELEEVAVVEKAPKERAEAFLWCWQRKNNTTRRNISCQK